MKLGTTSLPDAPWRWRERAPMPRPRAGLIQGVVGSQMVVAGGQGIDRPEQAGADQGRGGFIDLERVFQGDGGVGQDKDDNEEGEHGKNLRFSRFAVVGKGGLGEHCTQHPGDRSQHGRGGAGAEAWVGSGEIAAVTIMFEAAAIADRR